MKRIVLIISVLLSMAGCATYMPAPECPTGYFVPINPQQDYGTDAVIDSDGKLQKIVYGG